MTTPQTVIITSAEWRERWEAERGHVIYWRGVVAERDEQIKALRENIEEIIIEVVAQKQLYPVEQIENLVEEAIDNCAALEQETK